jgi:hypothetical protein
MPDRYASRPHHWAAVAAVLATAALIAAGCTDTAATPDPSPAPPATAPEGDGGGKTGGTDR